MKTCLICGRPLIDLPYTEVHCPACKEALEKTRRKNRIDVLLSKRDVTPEERKERDGLIARQLREAKVDL